MDQAVQTVHKPLRQNCLQCHARAGGGDSYKRGDITLAHGNTTDTAFDSHMATTGLNLQCQDCHKVSNHRIAGRGSDIAQTDYDFPMGCSTAECHPTKGSPAGHTTVAVNNHVARVACQTCHIKTYGKNASDTAATEATEVHRDWTDSHFNITLNQYHPRSDLLNNLIPTYKFWNKHSTNYLLYDVTRPNPLTGNYTVSKPVGSITDLTTASKLYPFKYKTAYQPIATRLSVLIAIDTSVYWTTGDYLAAVAAGIVNMGFSGSEPYVFINTETNQLITHGVPPVAQTLTCNECHGTTNQLNLPDIGYRLKNTTQVVCTQCHGMKNQMGFQQVHQKHVQEKGRGCAWCHSFSRPERNLNENYQTATLTVNKPGIGNGTVRSADAGIICGTDCLETYGAGTAITLTATADVGSVFAGWTGSGCSGAGACEVTMNTNTTVAATFVLAGTLPEPLPKEGTIGTQITIIGTDFGTKKGTVKVGGKTCKVSEWATDSITCRIKTALAASRHYDVVVKPKEPRGAQPIVYEDAFTMMLPVITSVEPNYGSTAEEIEISGKYFGSKKGKVYFEYELNGRLKKKTCKVTEWSMYDPVNGSSRIRFVVPKVTRSFPAGVYLLKAQNKVGKVTASTNFILE